MCFEKVTWFSTNLQTGEPGRVINGLIKKSLTKKEAEKPLLQS